MRQPARPHERNVGECRNSTKVSNEGHLQISNAREQNLATNNVVCEERFVPALAVICDVLKIPDDVAGATLMAAGACSPEVVASFIALFITHSALGVGSVVGSEIFNHLCICAGSVLRGSASETSFSLVAAMA